MNRYKMRNGDYLPLHKRDISTPFSSCGNMHNQLWYWGYDDARCSLRVTMSTTVPYDRFDAAWQPMKKHIIAERTPYAPQRHNWGY